MLLQAWESPSARVRECASLGLCWLKILALGRPDQLSTSSVQPDDLPVRSIREEFEDTDRMENGLRLYRLGDRIVILSNSPILNIEA